MTIEFLKYENGRAFINFKGLVYAFNEVLGAKYAVDTGDPSGGELISPMFAPLLWVATDIKGREVALVGSEESIASYRRRGFTVKPRLRVVS